MRRDQSGINNTCPLIDDVINAINDVDWSDNNHYDEKSLIAILEKIRTANSNLRVWGNDMHNERNEFEKDLDYANDRIQQLERELSEKVDEIKELEDRISYMEDLMNEN
jgi:predicted  nucleic acid-binding Zn-ribbon protein